MDENVFNKAESLGKISSDIILSNQYEVSIGGFADPTYGIKTYYCSLKVSELKEDITTFKKLTQDNIWPVSQIIQREIDWRRVSEISKVYIRSETRDIKYFPPLTIAILPKNEEERIGKEYEYDSQIQEVERTLIFQKSKFSNNEKVKEYFIKSKDLSPLKNFYVLNLNDDFNYNILCWDKAKYYAVVIDGQHRYEALIESAEKENKVLNYIQDVVFIDLSITLNHMKETSRREITPTEAVRTVFVDINSTAQMVTPVRKILMDDKDLAAILVQSIVNDVNDDGSRTGLFIQPQLIDWHVEAYKHELPHITSILVLYQIITDNILKRKNLSSLDDLRQKNRVKNWVALVNEKFRIDITIKEKEVYSEFIPLSDSLEKFLSNAEDDSEETDFIFSYDYRILTIAKKTFEELYAKSIIRCFYEITPYKLIIEYLKDNGAFNNENTLYRALVITKSEREKKSVYKTQFNEHSDTMKKKFNPAYELIYTVLGQKAIFDLYFKRIDYDFSSNISEEYISSLTTKFITDINEMFNFIAKAEVSLFGMKDTVFIDDKYAEGVEFLGTLFSSFWEGIIYQEKRIIYNSQGVASLRSVFEYILNFISYYKKNKQQIPAEEFHINYLQDRLRRSIIRQFEDYEDEANELSIKIIEIKRKFLNDYLENILK